MLKVQPNDAEEDNSEIFSIFYSFELNLFVLNKKKQYR